MGATSFQDLPITDEQLLVPAGKTRADVENEILGDLESPNWERYRRAFLWFDPENAETKAGYKLIIARMVNGRLTAIWRAITAAVAVLNGARGGINIPAADKQRAFNHAMRYYAKRGIAPADRPEYTGSRRNRPLFAAAVDLLGGGEITDVEGDEPKWVQIAAEGDFPGYDQGERPFSLTRETLDQIVANLRRNPSYATGPDGVGCEDVIPWDFHHASELYPAEGSIPALGAPAQAWTRELEVRNGTDGKAQLWGLTRFLELARGYIRNGQYKWASLAVTFNTIDPATGSNVGAVLTSVALTNQPIIQGMNQLVASGGGAMAGRYNWYDAAENAEEAMSSLKDLFGLPEMSGAPEVIGEITKLQQWVTQGGAPLGVDVGEIVSRMRTIFNLPALSTEMEVLGEAGKVIARLIDEQSVDQGQPAAPPPPPAAPAPAAQPAAAAKAKEKDMELLKTLASKLGVREADAEVIEAVVDLVALRAGAHKALAADKDTTKVLLEAAEKAASGREKLIALIKALGVENPDEAVDRVAELINQSKQLTDAMPELENLRVKVQQQEDQQAEADVDQAIASRGYGEEVKDALLLFRKSDPEKFAQKYPPPQPGDESLLSNAVVTPSGVELRPSLSGASVQASRPAGQQRNTIPLNTGMINLATYPGRNVTERAMSYIRAIVEGAKDWKHEDLFVAACNLKRQPNVIDQVN